MHSIVCQQIRGVFNNCTLEPIELVNGITATANTLIADNCSLSLGQIFKDEVIISQSS